MNKYLVVLRQEFISDAQFVNLHDYPGLCDPTRKDLKINWEKARNYPRGMLDIEAEMVLGIVEADSETEAMEMVTKEQYFSILQLNAYQLV